MIDINKRMSLISEIVKQKPSLGKTAIMKFIYILQQVYKVPIGYDYEIYTYGPYSAGVTEDIQLAVNFNAISMDTVTFPSGHMGYELKPTEFIDCIIDKGQDFISTHRDSISEVISKFGDKTVKELELSSTIIYVYNMYLYNEWGNSIDEISESVRKIKPHFSIDVIKDECNNLNKLGIFEMST